MKDWQDRRCGVVKNGERLVLRSYDGRTIRFGDMQGKLLSFVCVRIFGQGNRTERLHFPNLYGS